MNRFPLWFRNTFFALLQPGVVAGLIPYYLLRGAIEPIIKKPFGLEQIGGVVLFVVGFIIMMDCILRFAYQGKGTLSPADPTRALVVNGLYQYSRNPMYIGVMLILAGEAIFFEQGRFWFYVIGVGLLFNLFIILVEEPRLIRDFGTAYEAYQKNVRRWV